MVAKWSKSVKVLKPDILRRVGPPKMRLVVPYPTGISSSQIPFRSPMIAMVVYSKALNCE